MKRLSLLVALVATFLISSVAIAAPSREFAPGQNKVICEASGNATAAQKGAKGCVLNVGAGGAAFAYQAPASAWDQQLEDIAALSFTYSGSAAVGGSPRFSIELRGSDNDGAYVFVDALGCNNGAGLVDVINDPTCLIYHGAETYPNWDAFVAAHPDATLYFAFVAVDQPGNYTINNVTIGKAPRK